MLDRKDLGPLDNKVFQSWIYCNSSFMFFRGYAIKYFQSNSSKIVHQFEIFDNYSYDVKTRILKGSYKT